MTKLPFTPLFMLHLILHRFPFAPRPRSTALCFALCLAMFPFAALAEKPTWAPIAEILIGNIASADPAAMSKVMHRCTALNMSLSALTVQETDGISDEYEAQALQFIQRGVLIELNIARVASQIEPDLQVVSDASVIVVKDMFSDYNLWLNHNFDALGFYIDNEFEAELKSCELAGRIVSSLLAG